MLRGAGWAGTGTPPYWLWSQVIRGLTPDDQTGISFATDGLDAAEARFRLSDALPPALAAADAPLVIPALNRDGDCLSDFVLPLFGSIAGAFVAAMLVGLLENVAGFYLDPAYKHLWVCLLFIVVLVWRPQGLLGRR